MPTPEERKKTKKLLTFAQDKDLALFDELQETNENLKSIKDNLPKTTEIPEVVKVEIQGAEVVTIKGEKGEKGDDALPPSDQQLLALIKPLIPKVQDGKPGEKGADGKTPTREELTTLIKPLIPEPEDGHTPTDKELLALITPLIPKPLHGSPDTPEEIRDKLASLKGDNRLSASAIKGWDALLAGVRWPPAPAASLTYQLNGTQVGRGNILNLQAGTGVTITTVPLNDGLTYIISATGGGGGTVTGTGVDMQVTYWNSATNITGDPNFLWDYNNFNFSVGDLALAKFGTQFYVNDSASLITMFAGANDGFGGAGPFPQQLILNGTSNITTLGGLDLGAGNAALTQVLDGSNAQISFTHNFTFPKFYLQGNFFATQDFANGGIYLGTFPAAVASGPNVIIGIGSGANITNGSGTFIIGSNSATSLTSGSTNFFLGGSTGSAITIENGNMFMGNNVAQVLVGSRNVFIGNNSNDSTLGTINGSIAIGWGSHNDASNQLVIGGGKNIIGTQIEEAYFGGGISDATTSTFTLHTTGGFGTNIPGWDLIIAAGKSSGNAAPASFKIQTSTVGVSGATLQTLADRFIVDGSTGGTRVLFNHGTADTLWGRDSSNGGLTAITVGSGLDLTAGVLTATGGGSLALTNKHIFVGNASNVATDVLLTLSATGGTFGLANDGTLTMPDADTATRGLLTSTDWNTFNNKLTSTLNNARIFVGNVSNVATGVSMSGDATIINTGVLTIANDAVTFAKFQNITTNKLLGRATALSGDMEEITLGTGLSYTGTTLNVSGFSSSTLTTNHILVGNISNVATDVAMSGDATIVASGALTLATVNANVGTFGSATKSITTTVNGKGLITAMSESTITPAVGSITGLGTGVATALAVNVGSAGAFVVNGGALGTPSSGTLTNATGLPISTGVSGLAAGIATWLATPSSVNLLAAMTDETGTGALVFGTSPTITTSLIMADAANFVFNATTGTKIGTATSQKLAFYNSIPIVQPSGSIITGLTNLGLIASPTLNMSELTQTDVTTNNVSISAHGFAPKLSNSATDYLSGVGTYTKPSSGDLVYADGSVPGGNTIANTTTPTAFTSSYTITGATLVANNVIRVRLAGTYSTTGIAPTLLGQLKIGSTVVASTGILTTVTGVTNGGWTAWADFIVTNAGASGTGESQGFAEFSTAATTSLTVNLSNTAAISGIDFTASQAITVVITWGTAAAGNTITCRQFEVYIDKISSILGATAGGDLSGTYPNPTVAKINGVALGSTTATAGNILIGSGAAWVTNAMSGDVTMNSTGVTAIGTNKVTYAKFQQGSAQTMIANNTNGTANFVEQAFYDVPLQTYGGTITWNGTPPTTIVSQQYAWSRIGNSVYLWLGVEYTNAGTTNTSVTFTLPTDCPTPVTFAGWGDAASEIISTGSGRIEASSTASPGNARAYLQKNAANNGYIIGVLAGSASAKVASFNISYRVS